MNSKLISIPRTNLLYLPRIVLNEVFGGGGDIASSDTAMNSSISSFYVSVDDETNTTLATISGVINGVDASGGTYARVDQGLDTLEISPKRELEADLVETQYLIEMDNRFGEIISTDGNTLATVSFIDDDQIASYYLSLGTDLKFISEITNDKPISDGAPGQVIKGPRGTKLQFKLQGSLDLNTSTFLFTQLGGVVALTIDGVSTNFLYIDSNIRVTGVTTGNRIDIPVRFIKKQ